ncbi:MAG: hypothetical protein JW838_10460 [Spirochaetes bacterium]|nr:hypothetical protein [Spirochaetota bacterium]
MQFFFLLLFNVFLGAVLYLVISLKLERSATEYRERRLRKEMDAIIREFNLTAERNISILEGKIRIMRRLLEKTGDIKSIDLIMEEEESPAAAVDERAGGSIQENPVPEAYATVRGDALARAGNAAVIAGGMVKKGLLILFEKINHMLSRGNLDRVEHAPVFDVRHSTFTEPMPLPEPAVVPERLVEEARPVLIEKDLRDVTPIESTGPCEESANPLSESEIEKIVASSDDKYAMVSVLFEGGCGIEEISRYSGLPAGEVRLVLNLNRHMPGEQ